MQVYGFDPDVDTASNAARRYCPRYFRLHRRPKPPPVSDGNERGLLACDVSAVTSCDDVSGVQAVALRQ